MLKPSFPYKSQYLSLLGLDWTITGNPRGPTSVASKLNGPLKYSYAEIMGSILDWQRRLSVSSIWGRSRLQRFLGKSTETPAKIVRKCSLKVQIALSAAFRQCMSGGNSWYFAI